MQPLYPVKCLGAAGPVELEVIIYASRVNLSLKQALVAVPFLLLFSYFTGNLYTGLRKFWTSFSPTTLVIGTLTNANCITHAGNGKNSHIPYLELTVRSRAGVRQFYRIQSTKHCSITPLIGWSIKENLADFPRNAAIELDVHARQDPDTCATNASKGSGIFAELAPYRACLFTDAVSSVKINGEKVY